MKREFIKSIPELKKEWWGDGEWVNEEDEVRFKHASIDCWVIRVKMQDPFNPSYIFGGYLCGYCKLPLDHIWVDNGWKCNADVHGGITLAEYDEDGSYWIGFDCAHSGDVTPSMEKLYEKIKEDHKSSFPELAMHTSRLFIRTYRNLEYVMQECRSLAEQINANHLMKY